MRLKIFLFCFALLLGSTVAIQEARAQFAVIDAANVAQAIENIKKWGDQLDEMKAAKNVRENLQKINQLKQLKSLVELAELIDDVACLSSDYQFYLNLGGSYHCLKFLNYQRVSVNLHLSTDLLFKVATVADYFSMNSEGRIAFVGQVRESLEAAAKEMESFNEAVRSEILNESVRKYTRKSYYGGELAAFSRYTNH